MKTRFLPILLFLSAAVFCAVSCFSSSTPPTDTSLGEKILKRESTLPVGEKCSFYISWQNIPVGKATATVEGITRFKGNRVYKIVVNAKTNDFISAIFKIDDTFTSYVDCRTLTSRRFEAVLREGSYRKNLVVDYDYPGRIAIYRNLLDGSVKKCPIKKNVQDPVSAAYFFRTLPLKIGDKVKITVNSCEQNYEISSMVTAAAPYRASRMRRTFNIFALKPYLKLKGNAYKRAKAWGYISADEKRFFLYINLNILEIPWLGEITAKLEKVEYISPAKD